jgi:hypothetical protein
MDRNKLKSLLTDSVRIKQLEGSNKNPTPFQMAKNLAKTAIDTVKIVASGDSPNVSGEEAARRRSICNGCDFFNQAQQRCTRCGCFMAIKTYLKAASCPIGKW